MYMSCLQFLGLNSLFFRGTKLLIICPTEIHFLELSHLLQWDNWEVVRAWRVWIISSYQKKWKNLNGTTFHRTIFCRDIGTISNMHSAKTVIKTVLQHPIRHWTGTKKRDFRKKPGERRSEVRGQKKWCGLLTSDISLMLVFGAVSTTKNWSFCCCHLPPRPSCRLERAWKVWVFTKFNSWYGQHPHVFFCQTSLPDWENVLQPSKWVWGSSNGIILFTGKMVVFSPKQNPRWLCEFLLVFGQDSIHKRQHSQMLGLIRRTGHLRIIW